MVRELGQHRPGRPGAEPAFRPTRRRLATVPLAAIIARFRWIDRARQREPARAQRKGERAGVKHLALRCYRHYLYRLFRPDVRVWPSVRRYQFGAMVSR